MLNAVWITMKNMDVQWHSLDISQVSQLLGVDPSKGLDERQVRDRQARFGPNVFGELKGPSAIELFIAQFRSLVSGYGTGPRTRKPLGDGGAAAGS